MKLEFESVLKTNNISIIDDTPCKIKEIKSIECKLKWSIDPTGGTYGIKFWHCILESFSIEMILIDIETREEETIQFDSLHLDYDMKIDMDGYKMKDDFILTEVTIDKNKRTVEAILNRSVE